MNRKRLYQTYLKLYPVSAYQPKTVRRLKYRNPSQGKRKHAQLSVLLLASEEAKALLVRALLTLEDHSLFSSKVFELVITGKCLQLFLQQTNCYIITIKCFQDFQILCNTRLHLFGKEK